jgi:ubiquinone/menaquinone biosynthesis C-methylase UbiE
VIATVLGEVPDRDACVEELRRVTRSGGVACFAETRRDSDFIGFSALSALVEAHRFCTQDRRGPRWQYVVRFGAV